MDAEERSLIKNLQTHDLAEHLRIRRAKAAKEAGLPVEDLALPFPGNTITVHHGGNGLMKTLAAAGYAAAAAGALGFGAASLLKFKNEPASQAPGQPLPPPIELRVKWWIEDGQVNTDVRPVP